MSKSISSEARLDNTSFEAALWGASWDETQLIYNGVQGKANLSDEGVLLETSFGRVVQSPGEIDFGSTLPERRESLFGFTVDGDYLLLKDVRFRRGTYSSSGGDSQVLSAEYLLSSCRPFDSDCLFKEAVFSFRSLESWYDCPSLCFKREDGNSIIINSIYRKYPDDLLIDLVNMENTRSYLLSLRQTIGFPLRATHEMRIKNSCRIEAKFAKETSIQEVVDLAIDLSFFFSYCLGFGADIQQISLYSEADQPPVNCYTKFMRTLKKGVNSEEVSLLNYSAFRGHLSDALQKWLSATPKFKEASHIVIQVVDNAWTLPLDLRFQVIAGALEAFTRIDIEPNSLPEEQFRDYRSQVKNSNLNDEAKEWILARIQGNHKGQRKMLQEFLKKYDALAQWLIPNSARYIGDFIKLRNLYTHRGESLNEEKKKEHGEALNNCAEATILLCQCVISVNLGFTQEEIISQIKHCNYKNSQISQLQEYYR